MRALPRPMRYLFIIDCHYSTFKTSSTANDVKTLVKKYFTTPIQQTSSLTLNLSSILTISPSAMSRQSYTAFQRHLTFFSTSTTPPRLTILSSLRASLSLGLDFPVALLLSISLRLLYTPYPRVFSAINIERIPRFWHRTQLEHAKIPQQTYTCSELLALLKRNDESKFGWLKHKLDQGHVVGFWAMAADAKNHRVRSEDVQRFQSGEWEADVAKRRKGRGDVVPLWRGGPAWVAGHSWAVRRVFEVRVYSAKD
ncbi:hypothetical protein BKA63DRAFT_513252 [Paraphoma chrysanthemicola]|nr:hypothetical protein BKA63DRAFT_513252 [Paraphoma chrysanthemicola]